MQGNWVAERPCWDYTLCTLAAQVKPLGSHNTGFTTRREVVAPVRAHAMEALAVEDFLALEANLGSLDAPGVEGTAAAAAAEGPDALKKWFAGFLRAREIAEIDRALREGGESPTAEEVFGGRQLGPLQVRSSFSSTLVYIYQHAMYCCWLAVLLEE